MLPVVRDLLQGVENLPDHQQVFVEARHLRTVGVHFSQEKKWVVTDPATGEGDFEMVDIPETRPVGITAGELRAYLAAAQQPSPVSGWTPDEIRKPATAHELASSISIPQEDLTWSEPDTEQPQV